MHFSQYPRLFFAHLPTPLEELSNITQILGGPKIWIKRDDCTGLAGGGNKTRKLEFLMADALEKRADTIITQGAVQSNHVRQTAAIATKMGFRCHVLLEDRTQLKEFNHLNNGNVLLNRLFGATIEIREKGTNMQLEMEELALKLQKNENRNCYIIPGGGSNKIGALGYAQAAMELMYQANCIDLKIDMIVHATGSAGTQAGIVAGLKAMNLSVPVLGIGVNAPYDLQKEKVLNCTQETLTHLGVTQKLDEDDILINCDYIGEGYGFPAQSTLDAIDLLAKHEAILLDPVYSAKGFDGMVDLVKKGYFVQHQNIVFIHTGGAQALSGYLENFN